MPEGMPDASGGSYGPLAAPYGLVVEPPSVLSYGPVEEPAAVAPEAPGWLWPLSYGGDAGDSSGGGVLPERP